jgi:hypothetical protein
VPSKATVFLKPSNRPIGNEKYANRCSPGYRCPAGDGLTKDSLSPIRKYAERNENSDGSMLESVSIMCWDGRCEWNCHVVTPLRTPSKNSTLLPTSKEKKKKTRSPRALGRSSQKYPPQRTLHAMNVMTKPLAAGHLMARPRLWRWLYLWRS